MGSWIKKLANRACIVLWEKSFQNMRASCATDLADLFPSHVCTEWLGHTEKVANTHYRQTTETHFQKATGIMCSENRAVDVTSLETKQSQEKNCADLCAVPTGNGLHHFATTITSTYKNSPLRVDARGYKAQNDPNGVVTKRYNYLY